ncbi:MAG TPA: YCF48-related protein, partial [Melioribacteraceae bacterium]|nr:YCF48-related protein [Melioribacteraceae bacterium]
IYILTVYTASTNNWGSWVGELTFATVNNSVTVTAPDGGEHWVIGTTQNITWTSQNVSNVKIEISTNNGTNWQTVVASVSATPGTYAYVVPNTPSGLCIVRVSDANNSAINDVSNGTFTISSQTSAYDWEVVTSPVTTDLTAVSIVNSQISWICGNGGVVLLSVNGGATWSKVTNVTGNPDLYSISGISSTKAIVGDGSGNIWRTTDGGTTWTKVSTNSGSFINVVDFVDENLAYAQGDPTSSVWRLLKSTDGGATWALATSLTAASGEAGWNCSYDRVGTNVWFGTNKTKIYKSSTGLEGPWTSGVTGSSVNTYGVAFSDALKGIAVVNDGTTTGGKVMKTIDGGANWTLVNFPITATANLADFIDGTPYVWIGTFQNGILHSTDYGTTWISDRLPTSVAGVNAIKVYQDATNGIAVGAAGLILKSTMGSIIPVELTSFTAKASGKIVDLTWKTATETNNLGFEVQRKVENGEWTNIGFRAGQGNSTEVTAYSFIDDLTDINSALISYRLKQVDFDGSFVYSDVVNVENALPKTFSLEQNYPNPFNPSTKINFTVPFTSNVKLDVYSINGEKVVTLINEVKTAGAYNVEFNTELLSNLASGMYIYRLSATNVINGESYSLAKKMMLLK